MKIKCKLHGDYRDIRVLRRIKGYSIKELAEMMYKTESYVTQLELGKINLSISTYNEILELLNFKKVVTTEFNAEDIRNSVMRKGKMYMKNSNKEMAKQILLNQIEERKDEWCIDGVNAIVKISDILNSNNFEVMISTDEYPVYDGTDCGNYELVGKRFSIDIEKLALEILDNVEELMDSWSIPTKEGVRLDIYHLECN